MYLGKKDGMNGTVVIKAISNVSPHVSRFRWLELVSTEIAIMKHLTHHPANEFVVKFVGECHTSNNHYIAMEYCPGGDLREYLLTRDNIPEDVTRRIIFNIFMGVKCLHTHPRCIIHRDLKPANVFLSSRRVLDSGFMCKIGDFGLSRFVYDECGSKITYSEAKCGTPMYMSLERLVFGGDDDNRGGDGATPADDVWALGVMMFEMVCGISPFPARTERELVNLLKAYHISRKLVYPSGVWISESCHDLLTKILDPNPETRITVSDALSHRFFDIERMRYKIQNRERTIVTDERKYSLDSSTVSIVFAPPSTRENDVFTTVNDENRLSKIYAHFKSFYIFTRRDRMHGRYRIITTPWDHENVCEDFVDDVVMCIKNITASLEHEAWYPHREMCVYALQWKTYDILKYHHHHHASASPSSLKPPPIRSHLVVDHTNLFGWIYAYAWELWVQASPRVERRDATCLETLIEAMIVIEFMIKEETIQYTTQHLESFHDKVCDAIDTLIPRPDNDDNDDDDDDDDVVDEGDYDVVDDFK